MYCTNCGKSILEGSRFCTSCGAKIEDNDNNKIMGKLKFHRLFSLVGSTASIGIYIDGNFVGNISNDDKLDTIVSCGKHKISFSYWSFTDNAEITIKENQPIVYVDFKIKMGLIRGSIDIVSIREENNE